MGHYTVGHFNIKLKKDTPEELISFLYDCLSQDTMDEFNHWANIFTHIPSMSSFEHPFYEQFPTFFHHELFLSERWTRVIRGNTLCKEMKRSSITKEESGGYRLVINCELQNYEQVIDRFVDWIAPYVSGRKVIQFIGKLREDESKYWVNFYAIREQNDKGIAIFKEVQIRHVQ